MAAPEGEEAFLLLRFLFLFPALFVSVSAVAAPTIPLTLTMSEAVTVTGTPRVAVDVGGQTRYASYTSGSTTSTLVFTLTPQVGDVDMDGIALLSPLDLNGGTIKDAVGNNVALTFTPPNTTGIKVNYPSLGMDFVADADGRFTLNGTVYNDLSSFLTASGGSFTRASTASYYDSTGTLQFAASGAARFDYDPVTHVAKGLFMEESRENLLLYSEQFDNAVWVKANISLVANTALAPDGTMTAEKIIHNNGTTRGGLRIANNISSSKTVSFFAKAGEWRYAGVGFTNGSGLWSVAVFDVQSGVYTNTISYSVPVITNYSIVPAGNGWYRVSATIAGGVSSVTIMPAFANGDIVNPTWTGDGVSGIYVWGAQLEVGGFPTSYILTTTAAATRARDVFTVPTGSWFSSSAGLMYAEADMADLSAGHAVSAFSGATTYGTGRGFLMRSNSATSVAVGGNCCASALYLAHATGQAFKIAGGYSGTTAIVAANNTSSQITTNDFTGSGTTQLVLGDLQTSSAYQSIGSGHIAKFKYYPMLPAITQVQLLTQ